MSTPVGHMIFYFAMFIIVMIAIYMLIQTVVTQVAFWILRPSEMFAMDLVGSVSSLGGTTGDITADFRAYTENVTYYVKSGKTSLDTEKILCVISQRKNTTTTPIVGVLTTFNCFSMPFRPSLNFDPSQPIESSEFKLGTTFPGPYVYKVT